MKVNRRLMYIAREVRETFRYSYMPKEEVSRFVMDLYRGETGSILGSAISILSNLFIFERSPRVKSLDFIDLKYTARVNRNIIDLDESDLAKLTV